jgi:hypothetical protein
MALIERSFEINTRISALAIKQLQRLNGLPTEIYFPIGKPSLYTDSSQDYEYSKSSDESKRFLFTGIFNLEPLTGLGLDYYSSFGDEGQMYVVGDDIEIPRNSKIEVMFQGSLKVFRTQDTKVINGINGKPVFAIHDLVPIA